jgi:hypothetical protein
MWFFAQSTLELLWVLFPCYLYPASDSAESLAGLGLFGLNRL